MILRSVLLSALSAAYSVVVLPLPVGPVTRKMPLGRAMARCSACMTRSAAGAAFELQQAGVLRQQRITTDSPCCVGIVEMRTSTLRPLLAA
jgi:hypothetical protein